MNVSRTKVPGTVFIYIAYTDSRPLNATRREIKGAFDGRVGLTVLIVWRKTGSEFYRPVKLAIIAGIS
jgi:hypothetical protein